MFIYLKFNSGNLKIVALTLSKQVSGSLSRMLRHLNLQDQTRFFKLKQFVSIAVRTGSDTKEDGKATLNQRLP